MCDLCGIGPNSRQHGGDQTDLRFAGFFSADAIEAAVRQSGANLNDNGVSTQEGGDVDEDDANGEEDDDGT